MKRIAFLSVAFVVATVWSLGAEEKGFADISHADLKAAIAAKTVTLIDCNSSESFAKGHIPGALDCQAIKESLADKLPDQSRHDLVDALGEFKSAQVTAEEVL